jgi:hypothetical protein
MASQARPSARGKTEEGAALDLGKRGAQPLREHDRLGDVQWWEDRRRDAPVVAVLVCAAPQFVAGLELGAFVVVPACVAAFGAILWSAGVACLPRFGQWIAVVAFGMNVVVLLASGIDDGLATPLRRLPSAAGLAAGIARAAAAGVGNAWKRRS